MQYCKISCSWGQLLLQHWNKYVLTNDITNSHFSVSHFLPLNMCIWVAQSIQRLGCGLDDGGIRFWFLEGAKFIFFFNFQTGSGTRPGSYPMGTGGYFLCKSHHGVNITIHLYLVSRLKVCKAVPLYLSMALQPFCWALDVFSVT
jgi:hypothetical protein